MRTTIMATGALALFAFFGAAACADDVLPPAGTTARVGEAAPTFTVTDIDGRTHSLADYTKQGKVVVLEWFNPDCPAVKQHHERAKTMKELAAKYKDKNVVWLAINSGAPGKQGTGAERNQRAKGEYQIEYPIVLDPTGAIGKAYAARVTPTMVVVDAQGKVAYHGAIDENRKDGANYVDRAVGALLEGKPVETRETRAYG